MPPDGQTDTIRGELLRNARLVNLPDRRFLERMHAQARQDVRYGLTTSCGGLALDITVLASGVMTLKATSQHALIENGQMIMSSESETATWSDTGEIALIPTRLGRRHLSGEVTEEIVLDAFLSSFGTHTTTAGDFDYAYWQRGMELYAGVIATDLGTPVEIIHHLPLMSPYVVDAGGKSPLMAEATSHVFSIDDSDTEEQIQYRSPVMKIQQLLQPEAMDLVLHLPSTVVRRQHREIFTAEPDDRPLSVHMHDFAAHMQACRGLKNAG